MQAKVGHIAHYTTKYRKILRLISCVIIVDGILAENKSCTISYSGFGKIMLQDHGSIIVTILIILCTFGIIFVPKNLPHCIGLSNNTLCLESDMS